MGRRHKSYSENAKPRSILTDLWSSFWEPPHEHCPRCGNHAVHYYDPFFFSPMRTLQGRRRIKCPQCRFVWRPSSRGRSVLQRLNPFRSY